MIKYCSCHTWLNTQLGKYAVSLIQYQMCLATLVSSQRSCKFKRPCRLLKGLRYCCITKHRIFSNTNEYRRELFCQGRSINNIPPTSATLWIHTLRSCYIAGHVPTQEDWGWKFENNKSIPHWTYFPEAVDAIRDLIKCACKPEKSCRGWCKCVQSQLLCTELCVCKGQCERE